MVDRKGKLQRWKENICILRPTVLAWRWAPNRNQVYNQTEDYPPLICSVLRGNNRIGRLGRKWYLKPRWEQKSLKQPTLPRAPWGLVVFCLAVGEFPSVPFRVCQTRAMLTSARALDGVSSHGILLIHTLMCFHARTHLTSKPEDISIGCSSSGRRATIYNRRWFWVGWAVPGPVLLLTHRYPDLTTRPDITRTWALIAHPEYPIIRQRGLPLILVSPGVIHRRGMLR